jgi:hypothetical protein
VSIRPAFTAPITVYEEVEEGPLHIRFCYRGSRIRFAAGAGNFSLHHHVQKDSEAHPASYTMGTGGSFRGGKAAGA